MPTKERGATLTELIVAIGLMGIISVLVSVMMQNGSKYLRNTRIQLELQRGALIALNWMSKDVAEGSPVAFHVEEWGSDPTPPIVPPTCVNPPGVVFASPRDAGGQVSYSGTNIEWNSLICYYVDLADEGKLYRVSESMPTAIEAPLIDPTSQSTDYFDANRTSLNNRILARHIDYFDVKRLTTGIQIRLQASDPAGQFSILTETLVHPRN